MIETVAKPPATIVAYEAIDTSELDRDVLPLAVDETTSIVGINVRAIPVYNRPAVPHVRPSGGLNHPGGRSSASS